VGNKVEKRRYYEKIIINADSKEKDDIQLRLLTEGYSIEKMEYVKRGRFKKDVRRIKIIGRKEITSFNIQTAFGRK
jgi:hypothetical protein